MQFPRVMYPQIGDPFLVYSQEEMETKEREGASHEKPVKAAPVDATSDLPFAQVLLARVNDLDERVKALEAKRGPGRPPKGE